LAFGILKICTKEVSTKASDDLVEEDGEEMRKGRERWVAIYEAHYPKHRPTEIQESSGRPSKFTGALFVADKEIITKPYPYSSGTNDLL
jgi:hypothetical protein